MREMKIDELYREYGRLVIQLEIVQNKLKEIKAQIITEMRNPKKGKNGK